MSEQQGTGKGANIGDLVFILFLFVLFAKSYPTGVLK
jgi:hypothetical protein